MKSNLFRFFVLTAAIVMAVGAADAAPQKEIVLVDHFTRAREVPVPYMEAVRGNVLAGFADRGRHEVIDAETLRELDPYRKSEAEREETIRATGARYVVSGAVTDYAFRHETVGGKPRFVSALRLVLSGVDLKTGKAIEPEEFKLTGQGATAEEADAKALGGMQYSLLFYIDRRFNSRHRCCGSHSPMPKDDRKSCMFVAEQRWACSAKTCSWSISKPTWTEPSPASKSENCG